jgi:hypothetical protein
MKLSAGAVLICSALLLAPSAAARKDPNLLRAEAFVDKRCPAQEREIATDVWMRGWRFNALYGNCRAGDGRDQHVWFFSRARFIGSDTREPDSSKDIVALWRDGTTIAFMYVLYRRGDPNCCPTGGGKIVRFRIVGNHVKALDPLPPHQLGSIPLGR